MWALLSDPGHADGFGHLGDASAPLRRLVEHLARRDYAGRVYAFASGASFNLTLAPTARQAGGHDEVGIEYLPDRGLFEVGYSDGTGPTHGRARHRTAVSRVCRPQEVVEVIDRDVEKLLQSRPAPEPDPTPVQMAFLLVMCAGMFVFLVFWLLLWAGLPVGPMAVLSMGVAGTALGLNFLCEALLPRRLSTLPKPTPGRPPPAQMGRLTALGAGLWCGTGGVAALGYGWLTEHIVPGILGGLAVGFVLVMVGANLDRRADAARAAEEARRSIVPAPADPPVEQTAGEWSVSGTPRSPSPEGCQPVVSGSNRR